MSGFYLADALRWAGHRVFHATVLADGPPELCISAILLQGVSSFVPEIVVDRRVSDRAIVHVHLTSQVLERPGGWQNYVSISRFSFCDSVHPILVFAQFIVANSVSLKNFRTKTFLRIDDFNIIQVHYTLLSGLTRGPENVAMLRT